jgi:hypothetical protein
LVFAACSKNEENNTDWPNPDQKKEKDKNFIMKIKEYERKGIRNTVFFLRRIRNTVATRIFSCNACIHIN